QPKIKVIVSDKLQGYTMRDTIEVDGYRKTDFVGGSEYFLKKNNNEVKMIPAKKVAVVTQIQDFWSQLWFYNHSADYILNGIDQKVRTQLLTNCRYYIFNLQANKLIFQDDYLTDYLLQLIHTICPEGIFKGGNSGLNILIMKSDEPKSFSFDNGIIVVTTALLAGTKNEKDLVQILSGEIGKIILDYNYQNVQHEIRSQGLTDFLSLLADAASGTF